MALTRTAHEHYGFGDNERRGVARCKRLAHLWLVVLGVALATLVITRPAFAAQTTRVQWIAKLNETFGITVTEDEYPDEYYSDLDPDASWYQDVMAAVDFGIVDLDKETEFRPNDPLTRDFAARTLNYCLGFICDEENPTFTYSDSSSVAEDHRWDLQVAVNRGWFKLSSGKVLPNKAVSDAEVTAMIKDATAVWNSVDEESMTPGQDVVFKSGVKVVKDGTKVTLSDDGSKVAIVSIPVTVAKGDIFAFYYEGVPVAYQAAAVSKKGTTTTITTKAIDPADAFDRYEVTQTDVADLEGFEVAEGVISDYEPATRGSTGEDKGKLKFSYSGNHLSVSGAISKLKGTWEANPLTGYYYVGFGGTLQFTASVSAAGKFEIPIIETPAGKKFGYGIYASYDASGSITKTSKMDFNIGVKHTLKDGIRIVKNFEKGQVGYGASATAKVGIEAFASCKVPSCIDAKIGVGCGFAAGYAAETWNDGKKPDVCVGAEAFLYAEAFAKAKFGPFSALGIERSYPLWDANNSPVRWAEHWEDNVKVSSCSRGKDLGYFRSRWYKDGSRFGKLFGKGTSWGYNDDGEWVEYATYEYSLDEDNNATITKYHGNTRMLIIPDTIDGYKVVGIGENSFANNSSLISVIIPNAVTSIEEGAFKGCENLSMVTLPDSLKSLGNQAFGDCTSLGSITIPAALESAGWSHSTWGGDSWSGPFNNCSSLTDVRFAAGTSLVVDRLFAHCTGLKNVTIPEGITKVDEEAFVQCTSLTKVNLPSTLTVIAGGAFQMCDQLTEVNLPDSLVELGNTAFGDCTKLASIRIPASLETSHWSHSDWGEGSWSGPFNNCSSLKNVSFAEGTQQVVGWTFAHCTGLEEITIPEGVTMVDNEAFVQCDNLVKVNLPSTLTVINSNAFERCVKLASLDIPKDVTNIEGGAFNDCAKLATVNLPDGLQKLGNRAFGNCDSLAEITIPSSLNTVGYSYSYFSGVYSGPFRDCDGLKKVNFGPAYGKTRDDINGWLFTGCTGLEEITIPDGIAKIGATCFKQCSSLKKVTLPSSLEDIANECFWDCTSLEQITLPDKLQHIGLSAFENTGLTTIKVPDSVLEMGREAFVGCKKLTSAELGDGLVELYTGNFNGCSALKTVKLPSKLERIYATEFKDCTSLQSVELPNTLVEIKDSVFENCDTLTSVVIPNSVSTMGSKVFYDCDKLTDVTISNGLSKIPASTFQHCDALTTVVIPYGVTTIEQNAFLECVKLASVTIPRSVTSIADSLFSYPAKMTIYGVAGTEAETYANKKNIKFVAINKPATKVTLDKTAVEWIDDSANRYYADGFKLNATVSPADCTDEMGWKSSDTSVAKVDERGNVETYNVGTATITFAAGSKKATCKVTVVPGVNYFDFDEGTLHLDGGASHQIKVTVSPENAVNKKLSWKSDDTSIATVDENGLLTALKRGDTKITATTTDGTNLSGYFWVYVDSDFTRVDDPTKLESAHPYLNNANEIWAYTKGGAKQLSVTFDELTSTEEDADFITIYDMSGNEIGKYSGSELAGKTITVPGDTVKIRLTSDKAFSDYGFKVAKVTDGDEKTDISTTTVSAIKNQTYTGKALKPKLTIKDGTTTLVSGTDYTLKYANNTNVGTATVTITGKGNYTGTKKATFKIVAADIAKATIGEIADQTYTGKALTPELVVTNGSTALASGTDYDAAYADNTNVGIATVTITGKGNYSGTNQANFNIVAASIAKATVTVPDQTYTGKALKPAPTVKLGSTTLKSGTDYSVAYKNNTNVGTATVTVTGKGNYTGTAKGTFNIVKEDQPKTDISGATVVVGDQTYTGKALTPAPTVTLGDLALVGGTDYDTAYEANTNAGTATVTVTGKGTYTGAASGTFTIKPASIAKATVTVPDQTYTGKALKPAPTVKLGSTTLKSGTDYSVAYKNNTNVGTATVTVTGKGNYTGTAKGTFAIVESSSSIASGTWGTCPWEISDDGTLTVHPGTGADAGYESPWAEWADEVTTVRIVEENGQKVIAPADCGKLFDEFGNLVSADLSGLETSSVTSMNAMFFYCTSLVSVDCSGWDTSHVENTIYMFTNCEALVEIDVSGWNTSSLVDAGAMFEDCSSLTYLDVSSWDTSNVEDMNRMLAGCEGLVSVDVSGWDTSHVETTQALFSGCASLGALDVSSWDVSHVYNMCDMFSFCSSLNSLDVSGWYTSELSATTDMFYGCAFDQFIVGTGYVVPDEEGVPASSAADGKWWSDAAGMRLTRAEVAARSGIADAYFSEGGEDLITFIDVDASTPHAEDIMWLANQGISTGWETAAGRQFRPYANVARGDMAAFMFRLAKQWGVVDDSYTPSAEAEQKFTDVPANYAHRTAILWMAEAGISTGWDIGGGKAEFRPYDTVKRCQMAAFMYRLSVNVGGRYGAASASSNFFKDVSSKTDFSAEILWLAGNGVSQGWDVSGGKEFRPYRTVARCDMAAFLHRLDAVG